MFLLRNGITKLSGNLRFISTQRNCQEVKIPTCGGFVSGKWWGPEDKRPIVAFHGWQDNCGTFDTLIPYLPSHIPILALDCPGHGHSYRLPPGIPYHNVDSQILIKTLRKYFGWSKISLMGHSMGAIISYTYGYLFPNEIDFLICIDGLHPLIHPNKMDRVSRSIEQFIKYDALNNLKDEPPSYTYEEMAIKCHLATKKSIALDKVKYILARNIVPSKKHPDKFYFKRDPRLKVGPLASQDPLEIIRCGLKVTFPIFISKAKDSPFFGNETVFKSVYENIKKSSKDCQFHEIPGAHHVHLNQPEIIEGIINEFIKKHDIEDRSKGGMKPEIKLSQDEYSIFNLEELKLDKL